MTAFAFMMPHEPSEEELAEREADLAAVHNFIDGLDEHQLYALGVILSACMIDGGQMRAIHFHGQVSAHKRTKYGLCYCGSFHKATEHGVKAGTPTDHSFMGYSESTLTTYAVRQVEQGKLSVTCNGTVVRHTQLTPCDQTWPSLDDRMLTNKCPQCGAGPEVSSGE